MKKNILVFVAFAVFVALAYGYARSSLTNDRLQAYADKADEEIGVLRTNTNALRLDIARRDSIIAVSDRIRIILLARSDSLAALVSRMRTDIATARTNFHFDGTDSSLALALNRYLHSRFTDPSP